MSKDRQGERDRTTTIDWRDSVSAAIGSGCCVYVGMPCDVVKLRLQTQFQTAGAERAYRGFLHCFASILKKEGIRALWKGATPAWSGALLENVALLTANGAFQRLFLRNDEQSHSHSHSSSEPPQSLGELPTWQYYLCGGLSGLVSSVALCPMEVMKVRLQFQIGSSTFTGPLDCLAQTVRSEGIRGLYRGLLPLMSRDLPFNTIFLGSYGALCQRFADQLDTSVEELPLLYNSLSGGMAGFIGWASIFPIDVIKSRVQSDSSPKKLGSLILNIYRAQGIPGFYRGVSAALIRSFPANAALFTGVEWTKRILADF